MSYRGGNREVMTCIGRAKGAADSKVYLLKEFVTPQNTLMTRRSQDLRQKETIQGNNQNYFRSERTVINKTNRLVWHYRLLAQIHCIQWTCASK